MSIEMSCQYAGSEKGRCQIRKYDKMTTLDKAFRIRYVQSQNDLTLVIKEENKLFGTFTIDLNDFKPEKVYKLWVDVVKESDNMNDLEFEIGVLCERLNQEERKAATFFTHSLKRKTPERVDILNEAQQSEFIKKMKSELIRQIDFEKMILGEYFDQEEIKLMINDKYNFVLTKENFDMGRIDLDQLKEFNSKILFSRWEKDMDTIFDEFTTTTKQTLENRSASVANLLDKAAVILLCKTLSRRNHQLYGMTNQDVDFVFSLRNFIVTLILMSSITVGQKLDILYEVFDWDDGEGDGLDCRSLKLMANTVLNRNLQFVASNQVHNMIEILYQGEASCITSCVYTSYRPKKGEQIPFDYAEKGLRKRRKTKGYYSDEDDDHLDSLDLTLPFQDLLWKYHDLFGCKSLCFHPKYSPFSDLQSALKLSKYDIYLPKRKNVENVLCLVYMTNGVKRVYTAYYDGNNKLIRVDDDPEEQSDNYEGVEKILQENKYFCNIENYPKTVPKDVFMFKAMHVPYFSDFMRSETVMR